MPAETVHPGPISVERASKPENAIALGEVAVQGNADLSEQSSVDAVDDTRVDESLAWDMAHASKDERDEAARLRAEVITTNELIEKVPEVIEKLQAPYEELIPAFTKAEAKIDELDDGYGSSSVSKEERKAAHDNRKAVIETYREQTKDVLSPYRLESHPNDKPYDSPNAKLRHASLSLIEKTKDKVSVEDQEKSLKEDLEDTARSSKYNAIWSDEAADKIDEWAGILHDNPPTEAFLNKFKKEKLSARELLDMEKRLAEQKEYAEAMREGLDKTIGSNLAVAVSAEAREHAFYDAKRGEGRFNGFESERQRTPEYIVERAFGEDSEELAELRRLQSDPDTTIKQLHENYFTAVKEIFRPQLERYKLKEAFLDDIKSGRAAQWK